MFFCATSDNSCHYAKDGLVIGLSLVVQDSETQCIPVMNLSDTPHALYPGTRIGDMYPITSLKQAQEVLQADPQLSVWDSNSEDEELLAEHMADATGLSGKHAHYNRRTDAHMDPKDLAKYLQT